MTHRNQATLFAAITWPIIALPFAIMMRHEPIAIPLLIEGLAFFGTAMTLISSWKKQ